MADIDTNYLLKQGENVDAYNKRIAEYNATKEAAPDAAPKTPVDAAAPNANIAPSNPVLPNAPVAPVAAPVAAPAKPYTVQAGDTLGKIALKFGVPVSAITGYRSGDPNKIFAGETIQIGTGAPDVSKPTVPAAPTGAQPEADDDLGKAYMEAFMQTMKEDFGADTPAPTSIFDDYGIKPETLMQGFQTNPQTTVKDLVSQIMEITGLPEAKITITRLGKEIEDLMNERDDKFKEIDDNPFISAGTKAQRKEQIDEKYEKKIANRTNYLKLTQDAYDSAREEAQFAATTAINLYDRNRNFDQSRLEFAMTQAEKRLETIREMATDNPQNFKEIRGGLYNVKTGSWVVAPTDGGGGFGGGGLSIAGGEQGARLDLMASNLRSIVAKTGPAAAIFDRAYANAAAQGPESAEAFLRAQYINNVLSGAEREGFNNVNNGIANYQAAIEFLEANPDLQTGFYKETAEGLKPKVLASKDPRYSQLLSLINAAETPIRKATYGTALTPQELQISTRSLLNTDDDRANILLKMKTAVNIYKNGLNRNMANATGVPYTETDPTAFEAPTDDDALMREAKAAGINLMQQSAGSEQRVTSTLVSPLKKLLFGN